MKSYREIREELQSVTGNVKYFNEDFYNTFLKDYRDAVQGSGDPFQNTKNTDFYSLNSCSYCEFLSIFYSSLKEFKILYFNSWDQIIETRKQRAENEETACQLAGEYMPKECTYTKLEAA